MVGIYEENVHLNPKGPNLFSPKTLKIAISIPKSQNLQLFLFCTSNYRILYLTRMRMHGENFRNFDYIDCKILAFKVKKIDDLTLKLLNLNTCTTKF